MSLQDRSSNAYDYDYIDDTLDYFYRLFDYLDSIKSNNHIYIIIIYVFIFLERMRLRPCQIIQ
jgi:hypothetical protein